ncbi:MAG TPA: response regulator [Leptolyngbyaceae cyanobacterium]
MIDELQMTDDKGKMIMVANDKKLNILLVDDDDVDVMTVRRAFQKNNITNHLYIAANGLEALSVLREQDNSLRIPWLRRLILLDLNMPKMGGIEFLRELRADPQLRYIPVIVLTTSSAEKDKVDAYNLNVAGYIVKPVTFSKFVEVMATLNKYWTLSEMP